MMNYPDVKGMSQNIVFFTHNNKEDGGQESVSKVNSFEVRVSTQGAVIPLNWLPPGKNDRGFGHVLPTSRGIQQPR